MKNNIIMFVLSFVGSFLVSFFATLSCIQVGVQPIIAAIIGFAAVVVTYGLIMLAAIACQDFFIWWNRKED